MHLLSHSLANSEAPWPKSSQVTEVVHRYPQRPTRTWLCSKKPCLESSYQTDSRLFQTSCFVCRDEMSHFTLFGEVLKLSCVLPLWRLLFWSGIADTGERVEGQRAGVGREELEWDRQVPWGWKFLHWGIPELTTRCAQPHLGQRGPGNLVFPNP